MSIKPPRWFTCTPVDFTGGEDFFSRDSGLLCRGLRSIGVDSMAVMPGPPQAGDLDELIRTDFSNLESIEWWRSQNLDGVVLYAWGRPRFRKVAAAIHQAGIFLILNQDSAGVVSPLNGLPQWIEEQWNSSGKGRGVRALPKFIRLVARGLSLGLFYTDPLRAVHFQKGDLISCVSPAATEFYRKLCKVYGGALLAKRVTLLPHPVEPRFRYDGRRKENRIVCVGRWQDHLQKRTWMIPDVLTPILERDPELRVAIAGTTTAELESWHASLDAQMRDRVALLGFTSREDLAALMCGSQIFYSPSAFESFGIAAAEGLCCGCSVVAGRSVSMTSFEWFISENSGRLAEKDVTAAHIVALWDEIQCWKNGGRDADAISTVWCDRLHADKVAKRVLELAQR